MIRIALAACLLLASAVEALDIDLTPYRQARSAGALGSVAGRAIAEPPRPSAPGRPFAGTAVTLLPRSPILLGTLEGLKRGARDTLETYREAAPAMRKAREAFERELLEAGAPDLSPLLQVDQDGTFRFDDLPAGPWVAFGWYTVSNDVATGRPNPREQLLFPRLLRLRGFKTVTIWLRELTVDGGRTATVELTDRNEWFTGVIEEKVLDAVGR